VVLLLGFLHKAKRNAWDGDHIHLSFFPTACLFVRPFDHLLFFDLISTNVCPIFTKFGKWFTYKNLLKILSFINIGAERNLNTKFPKIFIDLSDSCCRSSQYFFIEQLHVSWKSATRNPDFTYGRQLNIFLILYIHTYIHTYIHICFFKKTSAKVSTENVS
jgi:hypothetical protein